LTIVGRPRHVTVGPLTEQSEDVMKNFALKVKHFLVSEDGPTAVEYAVMLALIVIVCLTAIGSIGSKANTTFTNVAASLGGAS
jgi:pilus assembly protein Flp/PilA